MSYFFETWLAITLAVALFTAPWSQSSRGILLMAIFIKLYHPFGWGY